MGLYVCINYKILNELTYKDNYPLLRTDSCLLSLVSAKMFSTLDLRAGNWQSEIEESDRDKTAFVTRK